ncbi:MAG: glyoxalase/bleomycin resistance/extradiol dioxygenase family protein, partial [Solirubrobacterales bacterium]|nr:glyoxalase/bleomycin resistance/extradiol dioxygenase family protein [Solirubrobacterales bacterium]
MLSPMFLGLRTVIYPAPDLDASKAWFTKVLGQEPYFDKPFFVGFQVGGYELGLNPNANVADGGVTYWGVPDADVAFAALVAAGATEHSAVTEVGEGIRVGEVREVGGSVLGIIENPHFKVGDVPSVGDGPG